VFCTRSKQIALYEMAMAVAARYRDYLNCKLHIFATSANTAACNCSNAYEAHMAARRASCSM
jgi:hypothetical protein